MARGSLLSIAVAAVCLLAAAHLLLDQRQARTLSRAGELSREFRYEEAIAEARQVTRAPADGRALRLEAYALLGLDHAADADRALARAARRDPNSFPLRRDWALLLAGLGRRAEARRQMERAIALSPNVPLPPSFRQGRKR